MDAEDEEPLALMARADLRRREKSDLDRETKLSQLSPNPLGSARREHAADILDEDEPGAGLDDDAAGRPPEIALVKLGEALASEAVRLARDAANEAVQAAAPSAAVEGSGIAPDRRVSQEARSHRFDQVRDGEGFPLHHADDASAWHCQLNAEIEPASSGAEGEDVGAGGRCEAGM